MSLREITTRAEAEQCTYGHFSSKRNYDPAQCVESVHDGGRSFGFHQCFNKPGFGPHGLYCKIHDPAAVERRRQAFIEKWNQKLKAERPKWYVSEMLELLRESVAGIDGGWQERRDKLLKRIDE